MDQLSDKEKKNSSNKGHVYTNPIDNAEADCTPKEQNEPDRLNGISFHQQMLSRIVKVGYEGLTEEEKAYWNSVY